MVEKVSMGDGKKTLHSLCIWYICGMQFQEYNETFFLKFTGGLSLNGDKRLVE